MKENSIKSPLKRIQQVDPPAFMLSRIQAKIQQTNMERLPVSWALSLAASIVLLIALNVGAWRSAKSNNTAQNVVSTYAEALNLNGSNQLYYD